MICFIKNRSAVRRSRHLSSLIVCHASKPNPCISLQSHSLLLERNRRYCTFPLRGAPLAGGDNSSPSLHTESTSGLSNLIHNPRIGRGHQCMTTSLQIENPMVLSFVFGRLAFFCWSRPCGPMSRGSSPAARVVVVPVVPVAFVPARCSAPDQNPQ